jgi:hypothetical protein
MLKKSDLKVIRGGALLRSLPDEKFEAAYATDTRLMGVLVIYIKWKLDRPLHQFFYIETTEDGIESYRGISGDDEEEVRFTEQSMLGGLGAKRVLLTMNEAVFLVQRYAEMTRKFGKPLPDDTTEYEFVLRREAVLGEEREKALFDKLCGKVDSPNKLINFFLMRYFIRDFFAAGLLAKDDLDTGLLPDVGLATLCRNEIIPPLEEEEGRYICESVIEDDHGHRIIVSEIGIEYINGNPKVSEFEVSSQFAISPAEAAMKLARPEYVTVYEIAGPVDNVLFELDKYYIAALQNLCEGGKLYIVFNKDNRHMGKIIYLLNDDVREILFVTVEDQLIIGSYTLSGIKRLENRMALSTVSKQLIEVARYEFKEPVLYDYTMSYGGDFIRYVEEIMGFEDDIE